MTDLNSQIDDVRSELDRTVSQVLGAAELAKSMILKTTVRATSLLQEAVIASEIRQRKLHARLARLELKAKLDDDVETDTGSDAEGSKESHIAPMRRSAADIILFKLASSRSPVPTSHLDGIILDEGLSKAAAIKAKWHLKKDGFATAEKRRWSITPAGRRKLNGHHPGGP